MSATNHDVTSITCPICLSIMEGAASTNCGHDFCCRCLVEFLESGDTSRPKLCPVCRTAIRYAHPAYGLRRIAADHVRTPRTEDQISIQRSFDARLPHGNTDHGPAAAANHQPVTFSRSPLRWLENTLTREWQDLNALFSSSPNNSTVLKAWLVFIFGLIYVISPIDLLPDWVIPGIGFIDDLLVVCWLIFLLRGLWTEYQRIFQY